MYISDDLLKENYDLDTNTLKADYSSIEYDGQARNGNIYDVIPSLKDSKYDKYIFIKDGKLKVDTNLSEPLLTYVSKNLGEDSKENLSLFKEIKLSSGSINDNTAFIFSFLQISSITSKYFSSVILGTI